MGIIYKGIFRKEFPSNPQRLLLISQHHCKITKVLMGFWGIFHKKSLKTEISYPPSIKLQVNSSQWTNGNLFRKFLVG